MSGLLSSGMFTGSGDCAIADFAMLITSHSRYINEHHFGLLVAAWKPQLVEDHALAFQRIPGFQATKNLWFDSLSNDLRYLRNRPQTEQLTITNIFGIARPEHASRIDPNPMPLVLYEWGGRDNKEPTRFAALLSSFADSDQKTIRERMAACKYELARWALY